MINKQNNPLVKFFSVLVLQMMSRQRVCSGNNDVLLVHTFLVVVNSFTFQSNRVTFSLENLKTYEFRFTLDQFLS
jgi:hypothetical protein